MGKGLRCYAWGDDGGWEARCVDLDLAVTGRSFEEVKRLLNDAIRTYIEDASQEAPGDRYRLLTRRAPVLERLGFQVAFAASRFLRGRDDGASHRLTFHCHA